MLFDDQIKRRHEREQAQLREVFADVAHDMGFKIHEGQSLNSEQRVLKKLFEYLKVTDYVLDADGLSTVEEQLERVLRPRGIMQRRVRLTGKWWQLTVGPLLGQDKDGNKVLFIPSKWVFGYVCIDNSGQRRNVTPALMADMQPEAVALYPALPQRELSKTDFLRYAASVLPFSAAFSLLAAALVVSLFGMFIPFINKQLFDSVIPNGIAHDLYPMASLLVGVVTGGALLEVMRNKLILRVKDILGIHLMTAVMARIFTLGTDFFWRYSSGEITNRVTSVRRLCSFANEAILGTLLTLVFSVVYIVQIFVYAKPLLFPSLVVLFVQVVLLFIYAAQMHHEELELVHQRSRLDSIEHNLFSGIQKIRVTGSEARAYTRWLNVYRKFAHISYNPPFSVKIMPALLALCSLGGCVLLFYYTIESDISLSDFIAFSVAYGMISAALGSMTAIIPDLAQISPLLQVADPILKSVPEVTADSPQVQFLSGAIDVSDLSFRYSSESVWLFRHFNLKINPGEYVAIVGESGCGKSTLLRLLLGFEQPNAGGIFYDNYDLWKCDRVSLRRQIGSCLQNGSLFAGDLFSNITITSPNATMDDAWRAAELAGIADDIREMPMQMHTIVSEGVGGFSGGQKQRLLIARALISNPEILLFDEATSALDNISQRHVSESLDRLQCTRVVVAHRLSTIRHCDRIIVLDKGEIAEQGTYEELMSHEGAFYRLAKRQL